MFPHGFSPVTLKKRKNINQENNSISAFLSAVDFKNNKLKDDFSFSDFLEDSEDEKNDISGISKEPSGETIISNNISNEVIEENHPFEISSGISQKNNPFEISPTILEKNNTFIPEDVIQKDNKAPDFSQELNKDFKYNPNNGIDTEQKMETILLEKSSSSTTFVDQSKSEQDDSESNSYVDQQDSQSDEKKVSHTKIRKIKKKIALSREKISPEMERFKNIAKNTIKNNIKNNIVSDIDLLSIAKINFIVDIIIDFTKDSSFETIKTDQPIMVNFNRMKIYYKYNSHIEWNIFHYYFLTYTNGKIVFIQNMKKSFTRYSTMKFDPDVLTLFNLFFCTNLENITAENIDLCFS